MLIVNSPVKLGHLYLNNTKKFDVEINNTSHIDSTITEVFVGCQSCTTTYLPKRTLFPNEVIKMTISFTPKTLGEHNKTVTIKYKTGELDSRVIINFTANVIP